MENANLISVLIKVMGNDFQYILDVMMSNNDTVYELKKLVSEKIGGQFIPERQVALYQGLLPSNEAKIGQIDKGSGPMVFYIIVNTSKAAKEKKTTGYVVDEISLIAAEKWMQTQAALGISEQHTSKINAVLKSSTKETCAPAPQQPLPAVQVPAPPMPRWVDVRLISRIAVALIIFGQGMPTPLLCILIALFFVYYLFDTGVVSYLLHCLRPTPDPAAVPQGGGGRTRWLGAVSLQTQAWLRVPSTSGVLLDGLSLLLSLSLSLFPGWSPDGVMQL